MNIVKVILCDAYAVSLFLAIFWTLFIGAPLVVSDHDLTDEQARLICLYPGLYTLAGLGVVGMVILS